MSRLWIIEASGKIPALRLALSSAGFPHDRVLATYGRLFDLADHVHQITQAQMDAIDTVEWAALRPDQIKKLRDLCAGASEIILAMDADMEGELIAHHFNAVISPKSAIVDRVYLSGMSADHIHQALSNRKKIDSPRVFAATARRLFDRHLGYQMVSDEDHFRLSMGRVISPLVHSLATSPARNTRIECHLNNGWIAVFDLPTQMSVQAETLCGVLNALPPITPILDSEAPYCLSEQPLTGPDAIMLCADSLNHTIPEIVESMQRNYMEGKISYPRTDSRKLGEIGMKWAKKVAFEYGKTADLSGYDHDKPTSERSFDAHEAVIPLSLKMASKDVPVEHLSIDDAVLMTLSDKTARLSHPKELLIRETGRCALDETSNRFRDITKAYSSFMRIERYRKENGTYLSKHPESKRRKPCLSSSRTKMWRDSPDRIAARRMIEMGIGRPSTLSLMSEKAAKIYLDDFGQVNRRGHLMLHRVRERAPELLKEGIAQEIEKVLLDETPDRTVAHRLSKAWQLLKALPLRDDRRQPAMQLEDTSDNSQSDMDDTPIL